VLGGGNRGTNSDQGVVATEGGPGIRGKLCQEKKNSGRGNLRTETEQRRGGKITEGDDTSNLETGSHFRDESRPGGIRGWMTWGQGTKLKMTIGR